MSTRAKEFPKTVSTDATFRQSLENATTPEARRHLIDAAGFPDVSKEDIATTLKEHAEVAGDLSDAELEAVAGGATTVWIAISVAASAEVSEAASPIIVDATIALALF
jgi:predicted ribosomally synthesized peptide with nif11-like leader